MKRLWASLVLFFLVVSFLPALAAAGVPAGQTEAASIDPYILEQMAASLDGTADFLVRFHDQADLSPAYHIGDWELRGRFVYDTLQATAERSQAGVRAWLDERDITYRAFIIDNSLFINADEDVLNELAEFPEVAGFYGNHVYTIDPVGVDEMAEVASGPEGIAWGVSHIGADQVWNDFGIKGQGVIVANMTTGVEYTHDALLVNYRCPGSPGSPACWYDPQNYCGGLPCDGNGQGTHTMGTMVGDDDPGLLWNAGVAPDAQWISCKACSDGGACDFADLDACANWFLAPNGDPANRPHVVNASWSTFTGCDTWFQGLVQAWRAAGIFPAFPPGAGGPGCNTMRSPGDYPESFASGATDSSDVIASFSGRGPSCFGEIKPEVVAPGVNICSTYLGNSWNCNYSGTSMSNSHTAGLAALIFSAAPGLIGNVAAVEQIIMDSAVCITDLSCGGTACPGGNNVYGWGRIDAYAAVSQALQWRLGPDVCFDYTRFDAEYFPATEKVYVLGGRSGADTYGDIWEFDPVTGACADTGTDMPVPISNYTANLVNNGTADVLCTFGGRVQAGGMTNEVQCYDPIANTASVVGTLPAGYGTYLPGAQVVVDNMVYVFGGFDPNATPYQTAVTYRYDPVNNSWAIRGYLNMARSYIFAAVVDGMIYAFGGTTYDGTTLTAQTIAERMDPAVWGWDDAVVADLPQASAEGRAFGFGPYAGYVLDGQIVLAGGGQWPYEWNEVWLYDVASDSYDVSFPPLINARRDHAGAFVPLCTADPDDGAPAMWVFGGRQATDNPPYMPAEYFPLECAQCEPVSIINVNTTDFYCLVSFEADIAGTPPITYDWDFGAYGGSTVPDPAVDFGASGTYPYSLTVTNCDGSYSDTFWGQVTVSCPPTCQPVGSIINVPEMPGIRRAFWGTTDFQVINLYPDVQPLTAKFYDRFGEELAIVSDTLEGGAADYYDPSGLPPYFTGTVVLDTLEGAMGVVHLEDPPEQGGNTIFSAADDLFLGKTGYTPIDRCTRLYVHNLDLSAYAQLTVYVFDLAGNLVEIIQRAIPPRGIITIDPVKELALPWWFHGSAVLEADWPIEVTVHSACQGFASYVAPFQCGQTLHAPWVPPHNPPAMTTTVAIQNPTPYVNSVTISYTMVPSASTWTLQPWGGTVRNAPFPDVGSPAVIRSDYPIVAVVRSTGAVQGSQGAYSYRSLALEEATPAVAVPVLFSGYQGWETLDNLWVMNVGTDTATVRIRYVTAPTGTVAWDRGVVLPGEAWQVQMPDLPGGRAAAMLLSDQSQPIVALAGAYNSRPDGYRDRQIGYIGMNFAFDYEPVANPTFSYAVAGFDVTFDGSASGFEPIEFFWNFGDGVTGTGQTVLHTYATSGTFTVAMTATNILGFGVAGTTGTVVVEGAEEGYMVYLPLVLKQWGQ